MAPCGVCGNECNDASIIKCTICEQVFHLHCVKNDNEEKIKRSTRDWKCGTCKNKSSNQGSVKSNVSTTTDPLTKDFLIEVMEGFKKDVFSEMSSMRAEVNELSTSVQYVSNMLDTSNVLMEEIKKKFAELQNENLALKASNQSLSQEVVSLRERMRSLEQYTRVNNIEISGIPETKGENINDLLTDVGAALGMEVNDSDVAAAHRVPSYRADRVPAIIVQFTARRFKEQWIAKFRQKKSLTARDINQRFPAQRVFVNDHLSPENKQFLSKLKDKGRELDYKFVWCRDGKFFAKKAEGQPAKKINTYVDIDKLN